MVALYKQNRKTEILGKLQMTLVSAMKHAEVLSHQIESVKGELNLIEQDLKDISSIEIGPVLKLIHDSLCKEFAKVQKLADELYHQQKWMKGRLHLLELVKDIPVSEIYTILKPIIESLYVEAMKGPKLWEAMFHHLKAVKDGLNHMEDQVEKAIPGSEIYPDYKLIRDSKDGPHTKDELQQVAQCVITPQARQCSLLQIIDEHSASPCLSHHQNQEESRSTMSYEGTLSQNGVQKNQGFS